MMNSIEWLALQRRYYLKPKWALENLTSARQHINTSAHLLKQADKDWDRLQKLGLELIPWDSERYPKILKEIYDPPLALLTKGSWPEKWEERMWVAVVGARKATEFGRKKVAEIVQGLVARGMGIISGLAYGIDADAHQACVDAGGVTWGVLGSGPDILYPLRNRALAQKMAGQGGFLSEFPLGTTPYAGHFPQRNRIISGLSQAVIIVEATLKSGSLITARFALEQGREVFVVVPPGENVAYEGNHRLLDEGATPWGGESEVKRPKQNVTVIQNPLLSFLKKPKSIDDLIRQLGIPINKILTELTLLESQKLVKKLPGPLWQSL